MFVYGFARYFLEFLRDDPERGSVLHGFMSAKQLLAIGLVIAGGCCGSAAIPGVRSRLWKELPARRTQCVSAEGLGYATWRLLNSLSWRPRRS